MNPHRAHRHDDERAESSPTRISVVPAGPLIVRGDFEIVNADGSRVPRRRATVALCRCGRSAIAPYCDGSHSVGRPPIKGEKPGNTSIG